MAHLRMWARAWEEVGENARVDATLSALLENDSTCISVGRLHAGLLRRRGDLPAAQAVLERLPHGAADDAPAVRDDAVANQLAVLLHGRRLLARHEMGDAAACNMHTRPCCMTVLSRRLPGAEHRLPSMGGALSGSWSIPPSARRAPQERARLLGSTISVARWKWRAGRWMTGRKGIFSP
ncbi:hypothetical protein RI056_09615 [Komagataeibacter nataicola]|uniref:hypothetical protein n=1 Tax=Komagataeibacter nataicola TaxID=265960 RepID=UPI0028B24CBC|nr:hypothetical protein [Komagataeibacter nataicola]WNM07402.1 hypothetical protein RI056_09615 [Komagataeibacter nataicola]